MVLIGSRAAQFHGIDLGRDISKSDIDIIMFESDFEANIKKFTSWRIGKSKSKIFCRDFKNNRYEIELVSADDINHSSFKILNLTDMKHMKLPNDLIVKIAPLHILFAIKKSHITYPIHWFKNIEDYHLLSKEADYENNDFIEIYELRSTEVSERVKNKVNLNVKNEEFFGQYNINRKFDHDQLHELVKFGDVPMFKKLKHDESRAYCEKSLWDALSEAEKLFTLIEEATVIALERAVIPFYEKHKRFPDLHEAFKYAVMKISTTLTSGWFREYAISNWQVLQNSHHKLLLTVENNKGIIIA